VTVLLFSQKRTVHLIEVRGWPLLGGVRAAWRSGFGSISGKEPVVIVAVTARRPKLRENGGELVGFA